MSGRHHVAFRLIVCRVAGVTEGVMNGEMKSAKS